MDFDKIKKEHGITLIEEIAVDTPQGEVVGYLRHPKLGEMDLFLHESMTDYAPAVRALVEKLWLGGDEEIKTHEQNFQSLSDQMLLMFMQYPVSYVKGDLSYTITVTEPSGEDEDEDEEDGTSKVYTCKVRHPKLEELSIQNERNPLISYQKLLAKLWLEGDLECRTNPMFLFGIMAKWKDIIAKRVSRLKKR